MTATSRRLRFVAVLLAVAALGGAGCKSSEPVVEPPPPEPPRINLADYEDFDVAAYRDPPPVRPAIEHDVPPSLLDGKAVEPRGGTRTVQGYRIQLYSSQDKSLADGRLDRATQWWNEQRRRGTLADAYPEDDLSSAPVYLVYRQPYYRVRLGNFATRAEALRMLRLVERDFPNAFIAPDTVTITR